MKRRLGLKSTLWFLLLFCHALLFLIPIAYSWGIFEAKLIVPLPFVVLLLGAGLLISFIHKDEPNFYITAFTYALVILLVSTTLMDAFASPDPFMKVLEAIYYTMILFSFILYTQRDFLLLEFIYFIFLTTISVRAVRYPYPYILTFLGVWIVNLRILFLENVYRRVYISHRQAGSYLVRQIPLALGAFVFIFALSLGTSRFIPHLNIPLAFLDFLRPQKETLSYVDRERLDTQTKVASRTLLKEKNKNRGTSNNYRPAEKALQETLKVQPKIKKPIVWTRPDKGHLKIGLKSEAAKRKPTPRGDSFTTLKQKINQVTQRLRQEENQLRQEAQKLEQQAETAMQQHNILEASRLRQKAKNKREKANQLAQARKLLQEEASNLKPAVQRHNQLMLKLKNLSKSLENAKKKTHNRKTKSLISQAKQIVASLAKKINKSNSAKEKKRIRWWVVILEIIALLLLLFVLILLWLCIRRFLKLKRIFLENKNNFFVAVCEQTWPFLGILGKRFHRYLRWEQLKVDDKKVLAFYQDYLKAKFSPHLLSTAELKEKASFLLNLLLKFSSQIRLRQKFSFYCWRLSLEFLLASIKL